MVVMEIGLSVVTGGLFLFLFMPHMIIPLIVKCVIATSPFKKRWILLNNGMWCSYLERGSMDSSTDSVVFLHGISGSAVDYIKYGSHFDSSVHLCFVNLLNHSDTASFTRDVEMEDVVDYLDEFVEKSGLRQRRFHLLGFSYGGAVSVYYSSKHPNRINSLILINPAGMCEPSAEFLDVLTTIGMTSDGNMFLKSNDDLRTLMNFMSSESLPPVSNIILTLLRHHKNNTAAKEGYVSRGLKKMGGCIDVSILQGLADLEVLYLQGDNDRVSLPKGMDYFMDHVPQTEHHLITNGSHFMTYTHISELSVLIKDWIKDMQCKEKEKSS